MEPIENKTITHRLLGIKCNTFNKDDTVNVENILEEQGINYLNQVFY